LTGGVEADAYLDRVMLERIAGRDEWEVLDLNLKEADSSTGENSMLFDGDRVTVFSVFEMMQNMVAAFGQVKHPGYFERNDSTRVSDLLERSKLRDYDVYYDRANLYRRHTDWRTEIIAVDISKALDRDSECDLLLKNGDSLHVYSVADVSRDKHVYIEGEVKAPGMYPLYDSMTVKDLIFLAGSYSRGASMLKVELARVDSLGEVSLHDIGLQGNEGHGVTLQEDDRLYVRKIPHWQLHRTVALTGEVQYPGEYVLSRRDETLYGLIQRAGGLTAEAFADGTIFERRSIGENLERLQIPSLLEKTSPVVEDSLGRISRRVLIEYDPQALNRIVLDVEQLLKNRGSEGDIVLEAGDRIFIPQRPSGISVLGAVGANGTIGYHPGKNVKFYVKRAGNLSSEADKKGVRLIRANGEVYSHGGTLGMKVRMGDVVVVPTKIHQKSNWGKTIATALTTTTGVLTSVLLISKL